MTDNVIPMPLPALRKMTTPQLLLFVGKDPRKWAQAFLEIYEADDMDTAMSEDWVTEWFAKAMEVARS